MENYKRLITRGEDGHPEAIDNIPIDRMGGNEIILSFSKVINRLAELEDKIEKGELVESINNIN